MMRVRDLFQTVEILKTGGEKEKFREAGFYLLPAEFIAKASIAEGHKIIFKQIKDRNLNLAFMSFQSISGLFYLSY